MYTNNTLDIGLMWERQDRNNTKNAAGLATFLFGWEGRRRREAKAKHEKRGHFGRIFRARNGMGIGQVPKHKKCGPTGRIFRVWMRVRVRVRSSMKTRPFRPRFSRREWGRN